MLSNKFYTCEICKTKPDQISHHKSHIETQKHKYKKELFELKLEKLSKEELINKYNEENINSIIISNETKIHEPIKKLTIEEENINQKELELIMDNHVITNKEALKDKIHEIHNYLRNNGAGYGMNALKVFNILYGLKKIEENGLLDKVDLKRPECEFSHLLKLANDDKNEELGKLIYKDVLDSINKSNIKNILFYEIPTKITNSTFSYLIKEINKISKIEKQCNVLLSGKVYEYFIGRDQNAISELGAYFTDRHIVDYIYEKINIKLNKDKTIKSMCDMFGGSGGFTTGYINYLNEKFKNKIDWKTEINKIYHYDMNQDVIKSAALEFFCLTNEIPNMNSNIQYKNSFTNKLDDKKHDLIITNPPYGGDKNNKTNSQIKREKVKNYIKNKLKVIDDENKIENFKKQLKNLELLEKHDKNEIEKHKVMLKTSSQRINKFAKKYDLKGNDKESCSLILMMDMLEENGICAGVLKEGVFFNRVYGNLRKCLINNFNVKKVISVPQDQFENTSTKTSIIIFENTKEKTTEVEFYELVIERFEEDKFEDINDNIELIENKGDIKCLTDKLISVATLEELNENKIYSLNGKDYNKRQIKCGKDYELKKLGDICKINEHKELENKNYKYVEISDLNNNIITNYTNINKNDLQSNAKNIANYNDILIASVRPKKEKMILLTNNIKNINEYVFTSALIKLKPNNKNTAYYIYAMLYSMIDNFEKDLCNGSSYPRFSSEDLKKLQIPIPKSQDKINGWVEKISKQYDIINLKKNKVNELETEIKNKITDICENEECEDFKIKDICKINIGTRITKKNNENNNNNKIPVYGGGDITFYTNISNRNKNTLIVSRYAMSIKCVRLIPYDFYLNDSGLSIESKNIKTQMYINYYLLNEDNQKIIYEKCTSGSIQNNININLFEQFKIKIPKNKKLIDKMEPLFKEVEQLQTDIKKVEEKYNKLIQELSNEAIPKNNKIKEIKNDNNDDNESIKSNKKIIDELDELDELDNIVISDDKKSKKKKSKNNIVNK
jgi:type I restriction-modification system DNA methylase subunit